MRIRPILLLASAVMLAACESTSAPGGVEGRYILTDVDANDLDGFDPLPDGATTNREVIDGTLTLRAPGQALYVMRSRVLEMNVPRQQIETDTIRARYTVQDTVLTFTHVGATRFRLGDMAFVRSRRRVDAHLLVPVPRHTGQVVNYAARLQFTR